MTKQQFLETLRQKISILEESEQQDMLEEYAQHIDMGMAGGLTEEQAVGELGDPEALAAEILEAYHVNPSYLSSVPKKSISITEGLHQSAGFFRRMGSGIAGGFGRFFRWLGRGFAAMGDGLARLGQRIAGLFRRHKKAPESGIFPEETVSAPLLRPRKKIAGSSAVSMLRRFAAALLRFCINAALVCVALPLLITVLALLLATGTLLVLVVLGYPLVGPLLCCLGAAASSAALLLLIATLFRHKKKSDLPPASYPETSLEVNPYA